MESKPLFNFKLANNGDRSLIHSWLAQQHISQWFDGEGLENTIKGLDESFNSSSLFQYWLVYKKNHPFALLMTSEVSKPEDELTQWCAEEGKAITLDVMIGDIEYLGRGLSHILIQQFLIREFPDITEVLIDPEVTNSRAIHVYEKAGFQIVNEYIPSYNPLPHYMMRLSMKNLK